MSEPKDRPIPWVKVVDQDGKWCILDAEPMPVNGLVIPRIVAENLTEKDAEYIIEAVNTHWENVTNLEMADEYIEELKRENERLKSELAEAKHSNNT